MACSDHTHWPHPLQAEVDKAVGVLLALKAEYRELTGEELSGGGAKKKTKGKQAVSLRIIAKRYPIASP